MESENKVYTRRMDDLGNISIPKEIQEKFGLKATELPEFSITICKDCGSIKLTPVDEKPN